MDLSEKNPFSLYDFLGYAFPGAFTLYIGAKVIEKLYGGVPVDSFIVAMRGDFTQNESLNAIVIDTLLLIASYIIGHVVSFLSSITIEKVTIWYYQFPSQFLLKGKTERFHHHFWDNAFPGFNTVDEVESSSNRRIYNICAIAFKICCSLISSPVLILFSPFMKHKGKLDSPSNLAKSFSFLYRCGMLLLLLPWTVYMFLIGWLLDMDNYMARPLDKVTCVVVKQRLATLEKKLHINKEDEHYDFLRLIQHYEYGRKSGTSIKMDNYVALYGFLRCMTLLFIILFWSCAYLYLFMDFHCKLGPAWLVLCGCSLMSFSSYMGFLKFYRRYTVENFMALITDERLIEDSPTKEKIPIQQNERNHVTTWSLFNLFRR